MGRLDQDTTGLLLLTDDGTLLHKLTSPKHHVPKVYEVHARHAVTPAQIDALLEGVVLDDDPQPVRADGAMLHPDGTLRLTLIQGKYHQVKRMLAAVGNRCERLHRSAFGARRPDLGRNGRNPRRLVPQRENRDERRSLHRPRCQQRLKKARR